MGACLAQAALDLGHEVIVISGPVQVEYPAAAKLISIVSTEDLLEAASETFKQCDGAIGAAAPCDYKPVRVADHKIKKSGDFLDLRLVETPDVMASLGQSKSAEQWTVGFALETEDARFRAITKLQRKSCDLVVLNGAQAINSTENTIEIISPSGNVVESTSGTKQIVAEVILKVIQERLIS